MVVPRHLSTEVDKMDVRPGGQWRFLNRDAEGKAYAFHGVYHEIRASERMIDTFEFEGSPETGQVSLETLTMEALPGGRTRLTSQSVFQSVAYRDSQGHRLRPGGLVRAEDQACRARRLTRAACRVPSISNTNQ
jgi:uncharacterized protein YndB with AHSA1/START domain